MEPEEPNAKGPPMATAGQADPITPAPAADRMPAARAAEELDRIFQLSLDLLCTATLDGRFVRLNPSWERVLGYTLGELEGKVFLELVHPEDVAATLDAIAELDRGRDIIDFVNRYRCHDGSYRWIEWRSTLSSERLIYAAARDITERRLAQEAVRQSEEQFRSIVESSPTAMYFYRLDPDGRLILIGANPSADRIIGISHRSLVGRTLEEAFPPLKDSHIPELYRNVARGKLGPQAFEIAYGDPRFSGTYDVHVFRTGPGLIAVDFTDITSRKRDQDALRQAKEAAEAANRAKDQFIAVLSHELRTPLTPVVAQLDLLQHHPELPQSIRDDLLIIHRNVELEAHLIDDLLDISTIARGKLGLQLAVLDIHDVLRSALETCRSQAAAKRHKIAIDLQARRCTLEGDAVRLQQVFWNLLGNAIKYTPAGGHIVVRSTNPADDRVCVQIADDGIGMTPETLARVFDPFVQGEQRLNRRFGGLGLGLSISRALVEAHHGSLTATSAGSHQGSTFTVELPAVAAERCEPQRAAATPAVPSGRVKILLVEDSEDTARVMKRLLRAAGHEVETAGTVATGLELANQHSFDLLLCDIGLPDGTGWDLMQRLARPIRAIALSGFTTDDDIQRSKAAGFVDHLAKPIRPDVLTRRIAQVVAEPAR